MDIKTKFSLSPAKGTATEVKKNQDVNKKKFHLGTLRKREPGTSKSFKNEQPAKYNIQKTKDFVKRQRPKGQYHGGAEENSKVVEEKIPEYNSVLVPRNKKENGNHLLNFRYQRNTMRDAQSKDTGRYSCINNRLLPPVQRHKYNKEQFVQASCQFVVTASGDYSLHLTNPDILVDWKLIEQIKFHNSGNFSCPICLYAPVAGKMTRCGHVYCWPCILCHLHVREETGIYTCPICDEYIHKNDLKSVVEVTQSTFNLGDTINLRLMRREKNSLFATPVQLAIHPPITFLSVSQNTDNQIYSKLLIANIKDIEDIIESEHSELELELKNNPEMAPYIKQALSELLKRKEKLLWKASESKDALSTENVIEKEIVEEIPQGNEINTDIYCKGDTKILTKQSAIDDISNDNQPVSNASKFSYFYQAEDGQHMYLHAANVKMLEMQYGSLEHCPPIITGKLLEKEASICTENLRRRLRYLCHLPLTCPFELVEIELKPPLVSEEVLHAFHKQLNLRQKYRDQREYEERKRGKKIIEEENRRIGIYPTANIEIQSYQHFPQLQPELQFSSEHILSPSESATSSIASSPALSTFDENTSKQETDHSREQGRTFADIAKASSTISTKTHNKSTNAWPAVKPKTHSGTSKSPNKDEENISPTMSTETSNKFVNAWPVKARAYSSTTSTSSNKDEENVPPTISTEAHNKSANAWPVKSRAYSDTMGTSFNEDEKKPYVSEQANDDGNVTGKKKKKKKKGKGTVLFTTGMTSGYSL